MRLGTVKIEGKTRLVADAGVATLLPIPDALFRAGRGDAADGMRGVIEQWEGDAGAALREYVAAHREDLSMTVAAASVRWHPPIRDPGKICGVAMNNAASNSRKIAAPGHPAFFLKPRSSLLAHGEPIVVRRHFGSVHPEPELAVVIGRRLRDVTPEEAARGLFGFTIVNDVTGNGMRAEDMFHYYALYPKPGAAGELERVEQHLSYAARYKGSDTFCAMGPWIATADSIDDPDDLAVRCYLGDEQIADDSTRYYNFRIAEVLSFLSYFQTLEPGDVVSMGTAFRPGTTRKSIHHANLLEAGGPVAIEIDGLGRLENPVRVEDKPLGRWRFNSG